MEDDRVSARRSRRGSGWSRLLPLAAGLWLLAASQALAQGDPAWLYTARPGDTIWDLGRRYLNDWRRWPELQALNRIADPQHVPPGRVLRFPVAWLLSAPATVEAVAVAPPAEVRRGDLGRWQPLRADQPLDEGSAVATGAGGSVTLRFVDGARLLLAGESRILLERLRRFVGTPLGDSQLRLERGRIVPDAVQPGSRLVIGAPPATTSVRGTTFRLDLASAGASLDAEVLRGSIEAAAGGGRRSVDAGFGTTTRRGETPRPPVRLLPPPDVAAVPARAERVPFTVTVGAVPGAAGYRAEIGDPTFAVLLADVVAVTPVIRVPALPDGEFALRVRAIDAGGLEGLEVARPLIVDARPEPPAPLLPRRGARLREPRPRFTWAAPVNAAGYRFRLTRGTSGTVIGEEELTAAAYRPVDDLPVGAYAWQVATRSSAGELGPFSDPQPFARLEAQPVPEPEVATANYDALLVTVPTTGPGARYQVQLARDPDFGEIAVDRVLDRPELRVSRLRPDRYYLRLRTIEPDGYRSPFGPAQRIDVGPTPWWPIVAIPLALVVLAL